jgi:hypothetical protein
VPFGEERAGFADTAEAIPFQHLQDVLVFPLVPL